tara:strand:+ start:2566 stop:2784 length:219 start_codon:yes stop_codon:yes gene_type:complete
LNIWLSVFRFKPFLFSKGWDSGQRFLCGKSLKTDAGWSSLVARRAHNPKVASSNLAPATIKERKVLMSHGGG